MYHNLYFLPLVALNFFDGEETDASNTDGTFTQEQVNAMIAKERRTLEEKHKSAVQQNITELEALKKRSGITEKERAELEGKISALNKQIMTKDELERTEREKLTKGFNAQIEALTSEREAWKGRFTDSVITASLIGASAKHEAYNSDQIVSILRPSTQLVEKLDENGVPTGVFAPKVAFKAQDKTGKPVELELTPDEAVEQMKGRPEFLNLFKANMKPGFASQGSSGSGGKSLSLLEAAKLGPEAYRNAKKEMK